MKVYYIKVVNVGRQNNPIPHFRGKEEVWYYGKNESCWSGEGAPSESWLLLNGIRKAGSTYGVRRMHEIEEKYWDKTVSVEMAEIDEGK